MKYIPSHFKRGLILAAAAAAALAACGGGGGSAITTTVMDGLIKNAVVCVDTNNNRVCDPGETLGRTDATGKVTLRLTSAELGSARLIAMIGTDAEDADTGAIMVPYTLQAPAGQYEVISPLTTLVQTRMDADSTGSTAAATYVSAQTGLTVSMFDDFVAARGKGTHTRADVMARLLVVSAKKSRETPEICSTDESDGEKQAHIQRNLLDKLADISVKAATIDNLYGTSQCSGHAGNFATACAPDMEGMVPVVSHCTSPVSQTITFAKPVDRLVGAPVTLMATSSSGLPVTFTSTTSPVCTVSGSTLTLLAAGGCSITANQAGNANYAPAPPVSQSFAVTTVAPPAPLTAQSITFNAPTGLSMGTPSTLTATASSGLPVALAVSPASVCTLSGSTLTPVATGTCTVTAAQVGNASYAAAATLTRTVAVSAVSVTPAAQTITFTGPGNQTMGIAVPALSATATSGLAVVLASTTGSACTVSGTTLTLIAAGSCTVTADQAGNTGYAAAATVSRTFSVAAAAGTTSAANGKIVYNKITSADGNSCFSCHNMPAYNISKILNGANNPAKITGAINGNTGGMGKFIGKYTTQEISDIAAYLGTPTI